MDGIKAGRLRQAGQAGGLSRRQRDRQGRHAGTLAGRQAGSQTRQGEAGTGEGWERHTFAPPRMHAYAHPANA